MTQTAEVALIAQKWTNIVQSCCPGLARAEWHVKHGDVVITGWFRPRASENDDTGVHLQKVDIAVSHRTVDDYIHAPETVQFHANGQLVDFVTFGWLKEFFRAGTARHDGMEPEQWLVNSADLGLEDQHESRQWWWTGIRRHTGKRS